MQKVLSMSLWTERASRFSMPSIFWSSCAALYVHMQGLRVIESIGRFTPYGEGSPHHHIFEMRFLTAVKIYSFQLPPCQPKSTEAPHWFLSTLDESYSYLNHCIRKETVISGLQVPDKLFSGLFLTWETVSPQYQKRRMGFTHSVLKFRLRKSFPHFQVFKMPLSSDSAIISGGSFKMEIR